VVAGRRERKWLTGAKTVHILRDASQPTVRTRVRPILVAAIARVEYRSTRGGTPVQYRTA
jgi:hypothetical protein